MSSPTPSVMPVMTDGVDVGGVAVPPPVPALVMPLSVPAGCSGSVIVYVPGGRSVNAYVPSGCVLTSRVMVLPAGSVPVRRTTTLPMPSSDGSTTPSLSLSRHTRPPIELLSGISPKLLPIELAPGVVRSIAAIALGTVVIGVAVPDGVPPMVPATV